MDSKTVKLNCLTLGEIENEPISKKKWSVPLRHYNECIIKKTYNVLQNFINNHNNNYNTL